MTNDEISADIQTLGQVSAKAVDAPELSPENQKVRDSLDLKKISARWLYGATASLEKLIALSSDTNVSDAELIDAIKAEALNVPNLFDELDWKFLASEIEKVNGAAVVNGAVKRQRDFMALMKKEVS